MGFRRSNQNTILTLLVVLLASIVLYPYIDGLLGTGEEKPDVTELLRQKRYGTKGNSGKKAPQYYAVEVEEAELFPFDPNTADSTQLLRLGLQPWQVRNIYKYRARGGRYNKPSDFARLYGLTAKQYERLLPYIKIKPEPMAADVYGIESQYHPNHEAKAVHSQNDIAPDTITFPRKIKPGEQINVNTADTTLLKRIPGIGSYYARQIVRLRQRLGGLYSKNQLFEIENFPESSLQYISVGQKETSSGVPKEVVRLRINHMSARELSRHPYILYAQAKQIEEYRRLHGNFTSATELQRLPTFTKENAERLAPYIDFSD